MESFADTQNQRSLLIDLLFCLSATLIAARLSALAIGISPGSFKNSIPIITHHDTHQLRRRSESEDFDERIENEIVNRLP